MGLFIDIHAHAYRAGCPQADAVGRCITPTEVIERYDAMGIEKGVLLPLIGPEVYLPQSNEDVLDMCAASGGRLIPFCNIDPRGITNSPAADFGPWLRHYRDQGCKGIGEVMPNLPFEDPRCQNLFKHVEQVGFPFIFDISARIGGTYGFYDDPGLPQLTRTLQRFSRLRILGHGPAFWAEIGPLQTPADRDGYPAYSFDQEGVVPKMFRQCENLYGDLSAGSGFNALARNLDYAVEFLNEFQDRLLFGTDIFRPDGELPMAALLLDLKQQGRISEHVFAKIARNNALKLLQLD